MAEEVLGSNKPMQKSWIERIGQMIGTEPQDREDLLDILREADSILEESSNPNLVILYNGKVMGMKYGAINFNTKSSSEITLLAHTGFNIPTYLNGSYNVDGLFLVTDEILIENRIRSNNFSEGASDKEAMIQKYLQRSLWYNSYVRTQVDRLGLKQIFISVEMQPEEIADKCMKKIIIDKKL